VFTGISAFESRIRKLTIAKKGALFWVKKVRSIKFNKPILKAYPLAYWADKDVWQYIEMNNLPINPVYDLVDRTGCMTCTGYIGWEKRISSANPSLYRKIMHMMGKSVLYDFFDYKE